MEKRIKIGVLAIMAVALLAMVSCRKVVDYSDCPIMGHWGCEQYVSCRTNSDGSEKWDTLHYEVAEGCAYEIFFNKDGSGKLELNNSPALIKKFSCTYEYDSVARKVTIRGNEWLIFLYGSFTNGENMAEFDIESLTDSSFVASWVNRFSESEPFFEKFYIKRIKY